MIILISLFSFIAYVNAACSDGTTAAQCYALSDNCNWVTDAATVGGSKGTCSPCLVRCATPDLATFSAANNNCRAVRNGCCSATCSTVSCPAIRCTAPPANADQCKKTLPIPDANGCITSCTTYECPIVKPICPQYLCVAPPKNAAQCKLIPAKVDANGCVGCPTYDCPVDCSATACLAVVLTCDASKGLVLKRADGINQCCDACVEKPLCQPPPCVPPPANADQCKFTPAKTDASGCAIGCPSYDCSTPSKCAGIACLAVVLTCDASKGFTLKRADGINQCCDACVQTNCPLKPCAIPDFAPGSNCKLVDGGFDANGCPNCQKVVCPNNCAMTACPAIAITSCGAGSTFKKADGVNQCCDACVPNCLAKPCQRPLIPEGSNCKIVESVDANGCANCPTLSCPSKCDSVACPQYFAACESVGQVTQKADPANGICCTTCIDKTPNCDCRSQEQKDCEAKGGSWNVQIDGTLPQPLPPAKQKKQVVACLCAKPLPGVCTPGCNCPDLVAECQKSGGKWQYPVPGGPAVPPQDMKQKKQVAPPVCSCAAPAGQCIKPDPNPCALVRCASPNCGPNQKIVTKPGECCPGCESTNCLPIKCPVSLASRSNCREPLPVINAKGVCPTACLCTEVVKLQLVPPMPQTIDQITNTVKMATGSADVVVVKNGNTFEVTIKGDTDANENTTNTQKSFADATQSKLTAAGSLGQVAVLPNDVVTDATGLPSSSSIVSLASIVVALLIASLL